MTNLKKDSFFLVLLFLIVCIPLFALRGYFGDVIVDGGRELYLPQAILNGEVLFKDIFGMYNPLGYQINALLYMLFGCSITTLQCAGILNAYFLLFAVYYISRCFLNSFLSFSICTIIFCYYIFCSSKCVNYILPYSFCMIYATTFFAVAVLFFTLYMKSDSIKFLYLSYLSLGLSLACKPEFTLCILPLFIIQLLKKENVKTFIFGILCYIAPILLSYSILFLQGFQWSDLSSYMIFIKKFFNTAQQMHYNNTIIEHWSIHSIEQQLFSFAFAFAIIFLGNISYDKLQGLTKEIKTIKELKGTSKEVYTKYLFFGLSLLSIFVVLYSI